MREFPSTEAKDKWGLISDAALREPVTITRHGRPSLIVMAVQDFQALQRLKFNRLRADIQLQFSPGSTRYGGWMEAHFTASIPLQAACSAVLVAQAINHLPDGKGMEGKGIGSRKRQGSDFALYFGFRPSDIGFGSGGPVLTRPKAFPYV